MMRWELDEEGRRESGDGRETGAVESVVEVGLERFVENV